MEDIKKDFERFAKSKGLFNSATRDIVENSTYTPVVLEERKLNVASMDLYSRLLYDRIIYFGHEFNSDTSNLAIAQLLYLSSISGDPIDIYINSPGGSVVDGLGIIDTINFIEPTVATTCVGLAASMGAVLLSCGAKGSRSVLPHSRVMIHQVSSGMRGTYSDIKIEFRETERCREDVYKILSENMGKSFEEIETLCDRNNWFIGQEAVDIGIADKILFKNIK